MFTRPDYTEHIGNKRLEARVRKRFGAGIAELEAAGFEFRGVFSETTTASWHFWLVVLFTQLFKWDVLDLTFPKQLTISQPLLFHEAEGCYGTVSIWGVTLASYFVDGTVLITSSSDMIPDNKRAKLAPDKNYYRYTVIDTVPEILRRHRNRVKQILAAERDLKLPLNFEDYTRIEYRTLEVLLGLKGERK